MKLWQIIALDAAGVHVTLEIGAKDLNDAVEALCPIIAGIILKHDLEMYSAVLGFGEINHQFYPNGSKDYMWTPASKIEIRWDKIDNTWTVRRKDV